MNTVQQQTCFSYPLGTTDCSQLKNLSQLKHTFATALFEIVLQDPDLSQMCEVKHLISLYRESHLQEHLILVSNKNAAENAAVESL